MTITIDVPDDVDARFRLLAQDQNLTPEELACRVLSEWVGTRQTFEEAVRASFAENDEVYRRLAKG